MPSSGHTNHIFERRDLGLVADDPQDVPDREFPVRTDIAVNLSLAMDRHNGRPRLRPDVERDDGFADRRRIGRQLQALDRPLRHRDRRHARKALAPLLRRQRLLEALRRATARLDEEPPPEDARAEDENGTDDAVYDARYKKARHEG